MVQVVPATFLHIKMLLFITYSLVVSIGFLNLICNCPSPLFTLSLAVSCLLELHSDSEQVKTVVTEVFMDHFYKSKRLEKYSVNIKVTL